MNHLLITVVLLLSLLSAKAQNNDKKNAMGKIPIENGTEVVISRLGKTRIIFKDGTIKKNCIISEFKQLWIIYIKDNVLHDAMVEKIKRIELDNGTQAIFFDEKNNPIIKTYLNDVKNF